MTHFNKKQIFFVPIDLLTTDMCRLSIMEKITHLSEGASIPHKSVLCLCECKCTNAVCVSVNTNGVFFAAVSECALAMSFIIAEMRGRCRINAKRSPTPPTHQYTHTVA